MRSRTAWFLAVTALSLAACGDGEGEPDAAPDTGTDAQGTVAVAATDEHGDVLVDADGMTLYLFEPDAQAASTCDDDCAASWPPLIDEGPVAGDGADGTLLGTVERDDGEVQVTYDDWPLYRWIGDDAPGDTTGQGVNDVWWVLAPDGSPITDAAAADGEDADADDGDDDAGPGY